MLTRISLLLAVAATAGAVSPTAVGNLVLVELEKPSDAYVLMERGVAVVEARDSFALARVRAGDMASLAGFANQDLGLPAEPVYIAWPRWGESLPAVAGVSVLARAGDAYVVSGAAAACERLAILGAEIKKVGAAPLKKPSRVAAAALEYDPVVARMIARVKPERYYGHIEALAEIPTRYSHSPDVESATAYIQDHFQAHGLQTRLHPYIYEPMENDYLLDCEFRDGGRLGWLMSVWGYVWRTEDYGVTWTAYPSQGRLTEGKFVSDDVGFVIGGKGFIARTGDGGFSWTELPLEDDDDLLWDIHFYGTQVGLAGGEKGALYRTQDGGGSWTKLDTPTEEKICGLYAENANRWWAMGEKGLVMRSYDGGRTWSLFDVPAAGEYTMRAMAFADANHATMVGYDGTVLYSADAGQTWVRVSGAYPQWPYFTEVAFADADRGWAVGSEGAAYRTDDGGATWVAQVTGLTTNDTLEGLSVLSRDEVWAAGYPSAVIHTTDGGASWTKTLIRNNEPITWYNVEATKLGKTRPDEIYILCGHYDSISEDPWNRAPGAEDNASGTAALLEAATALRDFDFDATIKLVAFSGEEEGLLGSRAYADDAYAAGDDIRGVFNMDMIAYLDEAVYDVLIHYNEPSQGLLEDIESAAELYCPSCVLVPNTGISGGSDHMPFWENGYPALLSIENAGVQFYPWYHTVEDLPEHLSAAYGAEVTRLNLAAAAALAGPWRGGGLEDDAVVVYPNPVRVSSGQTVLRFENLGVNAVIDIYNLVGEKVWTTYGDENGYADWALTCESGAMCASGIYFYVINDDAGKRTTGKVAVIK